MCVCIVYCVCVCVCSLCSLCSLCSVCSVWCAQIWIASNQLYRVVYISEFADFHCLFGTWINRLTSVCTLSRAAIVTPWYHACMKVTTWHYGKHSWQYILEDWFWLGLCFLSGLFIFLRFIDKIFPCAHNHSPINWTDLLWRITHMFVTQY